MIDLIISMNEPWSLEVYLAYVTSTCRWNLWIRHSFWYTLSNGIWSKISYILNLMQISGVKHILNWTNVSLYERKHMFTRQPRNVRPLVGCKKGTWKKEYNEIIQGKKMQDINVHVHLVFFENFNSFRNFHFEVRTLNWIHTGAVIFFSLLSSSVWFSFRYWMPDWIATCRSFEHDSCC